MSPSDAPHSLLARLLTLALYICTPLLFAVLLLARTAAHPGPAAGRREHGNEEGPEEEEEGETEEDGSPLLQEGFVATAGGRSRVRGGPREGLKVNFKSLGKKVAKKADPASEMKKLFRPIEKLIDKIGDKMGKLDDKLEAIPKAMLKEIRETEKKTASGLNAVVKKVTRVVDMVMGKLERFIQFVVDIALAIGSYMRCGVEKIVQLPACWYFYALEMVGKVLYLPIAFLFWATGQREFERVVWAQLERVDALVYDATRGIWGASSAAAYASGGPSSSAAATSVPNAFALMLFRAIGLQWDYGCPDDPYVADARYIPPATGTGGGAPKRRRRPEEEEGLHLIHLPDWVVDKCYLCGTAGGSGSKKQGLRSFPNPKDYF